MREALRKLDAGLTIEVLPWARDLYPAEREKTCSFSMIVRLADIDEMKVNLYLASSSGTSDEKVQAMRKAMNE